MSDIPFYRTEMGRRFYERTLPNLVQELSRLNKNLQQLLAVAESAVKRLPWRAPVSLKR